MSQINHKAFTDGACCVTTILAKSIQNGSKFREVILETSIDFPAEYGYALIANKWLFKTFAGSIGLIGASTKMNLISELMEAEEHYQSILNVKNLKIIFLYHKSLLV